MTPTIRRQRQTATWGGSVSIHLGEYHIASFFAPTTDKAEIMARSWIDGIKALESIRETLQATGIV
jgi:hypothetical protein